jgi:hypothetical protein
MSDGIKLSIRFIDAGNGVPPPGAYDGNDRMIIEVLACPGVPQDIMEVYLTHCYIYVVS